MSGKVKSEDKSMEANGGAHPMNGAASPLSSSVSATANHSGGASALHQLLSADGYYSYLGVPKPLDPRATGTTFSSSLFKDGGECTDSGNVDEELVKKNYRRLSLRHHPDRRGGDAETFRVLNRAKKVLTTPKLRKEYDLLGLDLDDDEEDRVEDESGEVPSEKSDRTGDGAGSASSADSVMSHIASLTLATMLQMIVRTVMMGSISVFLSQYRVTLILIIMLLLFVTSRIVRSADSGKKEYIVLVLLFLGVCLMHGGVSGSGSWAFWLGETLTMSMFLINSFALNSPPAFLGVFVLSSVASIILQGRFWRYSVVVMCEVGLAIFAVLVFPVLEMVLEEIMNEKLRKVGEKIRAHTKRMEAEDRRISSSTGIVSAM